jgi:hypothetical protein
VLSLPPGIELVRDPLRFREAPPRLGHLFLGGLAELGVILVEVLLKACPPAPFLGLLEDRRLVVGAELELGRGDDPVVERQALPLGGFLDRLPRSALERESRSS